MRNSLPHWAAAGEVRRRWRTAMDIASRASGLRMRRAATAAMQRWLRAALEAAAKPDGQSAAVVWWVRAARRRALAHWRSAPPYRVGMADEAAAVAFRLHASRRRSLRRWQGHVLSAAGVASARDVLLAPLLLRLARLKWGMSRWGCALTILQLAAVDMRQLRARALASAVRLWKWEAVWLHLSHGTSSHCAAASWLRRWARHAGLGRQMSRGGVARGAGSDPPPQPLCGTVQLEFTPDQHSTASVRSFSSVDGRGIPEHWASCCGEAMHLTGDALLPEAAPYLGSRTQGVAGSPRARSPVVPSPAFLSPPAHPRAAVLPAARCTRLGSSSPGEAMDTSLAAGHCAAACLSPCRKYCPPVVAAPVTRRSIYSSAQKRRVASASAERFAYHSALRRGLAAVAASAASAARLAAFAEVTELACAAGAHFGTRRALFRLHAAGRLKRSRDEAAGRGDGLLAYAALLRWTRRCMEGRRLAILIGFSRGLQRKAGMHRWRRHVAARRSRSLASIVAAHGLIRALLLRHLLRVWAAHGPTTHGRRRLGAESPRLSPFETALASLRGAMRWWGAWRDRARLVRSVGRRPFLRAGGAAPRRMRRAMDAWRTFGRQSARERSARLLAVKLLLSRRRDSTRHALRAWRGQAARTIRLASADGLPYLKGAAPAALARFLHRWCFVHVTSLALRAAVTATHAAVRRGTWRRLRMGLALRRAHHLPESEVRATALRRCWRRLRVRLSPGRRLLATAAALHSLLLRRCWRRLRGWVSLRLCLRELSRVGAAAGEGAALYAATASWAASAARDALAASRRPRAAAVWHSTRLRRALRVWAAGRCGRCRSSTKLLAASGRASAHVLSPRSRGRTDAWLPLTRARLAAGPWETRLASAWWEASAARAALHTLRSHGTLARAALRLRCVCALAGAQRALNGWRKWASARHCAARLMARLHRMNALRAIGLHSWRANASQRLRRHETCLAARSRRGLATLREGLQRWREARAPFGRLPLLNLLLPAPLSLRAGFRLWDRAATSRSRRVAARRRGLIVWRCIVLGPGLLALAANAGRAADERRLRVIALEHLVVSSLSHALARGAAAGARMRLLRLAAERAQGAALALAFGRIRAAAVLAAFGERLNTRALGWHQRACHRRAWRTLQRAAQAALQGTFLRSLSRPPPIAMEPPPAASFDCEGREGRRPPCLLLFPDGGAPLALVASHCGGGLGLHLPPLFEHSTGDLVQMLRALTPPSY